MGTTPNKGFPYPENTDKLGGGAGDIKALATAVDTEMSKTPAVNPIATGGTGANSASGARANLDVPFDDTGSQIRFFLPSFGRLAFEIPGGAFPTNIPLPSDIPPAPDLSPYINRNGDTMWGSLFLPNSSGATSGYTVAYINGDGRLSRGTSSRRFKRNIEDAPADLGDIFPTLREFEFIEGDGTRVLGYIAEELAEVPETQRFVVWEQNDDGEPTDVALSIDVIGLLLAQVATLNRRVAELERGANDGR